MENYELIHESLVRFLPWIILLAVWELIWKMFALWKSARNNHKYWFVGIALLNTLGMLPILYLLKYKNQKN